MTCTPACVLQLGLVLLSGLAYAAATDSSWCSTNATKVDVSAIQYLPSVVFDITENDGSEISNIGQVKCSLPEYGGSAEYSLADGVPPKYGGSAEYSLAAGVPDCNAVCNGATTCAKSTSQLCFRLDSSTGQLSTAGVNFEGGYTGFHANLSIVCRPVHCQAVNVSISVIVNISSNNEFSPTLLVDENRPRSSNLLDLKIHLIPSHPLALIYYTAFYFYKDTQVFFGYAHDQDNNITDDGRIIPFKEKYDIFELSLDAVTHGIVLTRTGATGLKVWAPWRVQLKDMSGKDFSMLVNLNLHSSNLIPTTITPKHSTATVDEDSFDRSKGLHLVDITCTSKAPFNTRTFVSTSFQVDLQESTNPSWFNLSKSVFHTVNRIKESQSTNTLSVSLRSFPDKRQHLVALSVLCKGPSDSFSLNALNGAIKCCPFPSPTFSLTLNVNHSGLQFTKSSYQAFVLSNQSAGMPIRWKNGPFSIECIGTRLCQQPWPSYNISLVSTTRPFVFDNATQEIITTRVLHKSNASRYNVSLLLFPAFGSPDKVSISVDVVAGDEKAISFVGPSRLNVQFNSSVGARLTSRLFSDQDLQFQQPDCHILTTHPVPFSLNSDCELILNGTVSYRDRQVYNVSITAMDTDGFAPYRNLSEMVSVAVNFSGQPCFEPTFRNSVPHVFHRVKFPAHHTYQCKSGYLVRNSSDIASASCLSTGYWKGDICTPGQCDVPQVPNGLVLTYNSSLFEIAVYECKPGYVAMGKPVLTCSQSNSSTEWSNIQSACADQDECALNGSLCGSKVCINTLGSFVCKCASGFFLVNGICTDVDECIDPSHNPCSILANCQNTNGSFRCKCGAGYAGNGTVCEDEDECKDNRCGNFPCRNKLGSYTCNCTDGWKFSNGNCTDVNECDYFFINTPCSPDASCTNTKPGYRCSDCGADYTVGTYYYYSSGNYHAVQTHCKKIDECLDIDCSPCTKGYVLSNSSSCVDIDDCNYVQCPIQGQNCRNTPGSHVCECTPGFSLMTTSCPSGSSGSVCSKCVDTDECSNSTLHTCGSNQCVNTNGSYACVCKMGFSAINGNTSCRNDDECQMGTHNCTAGLICIDTPGSFDCYCPLGNSSTAQLPCVQDVDECQVVPSSCGKNANCTNTITSYTCQCPAGMEFRNGTCADIDECAAGMHQCHVNATCRNFPGNYTCVYSLAVENFTALCSNASACGGNSQCRELVGSYSCPCNAGFQRAQGANFAGDCVDVDECTTGKAVCSQGAVCTNTHSSFHCQCHNGLTGPPYNGTCVDIDECSTATDFCGQHTVCKNTLGTFQCSCQNGFRGIPLVVGCLTDIDECKAGAHTCHSTEVCSNNAGSFSCGCEAGFQASQTARGCLNINECQPKSPCGSFSTCTDTHGNYSCGCMTGFQANPTGNGCANINECQRRNPCGSFTTCTDNSGSYTCSCSRSGFLNLTGFCEENECATGNHLCVTSSQCIKHSGGYDCMCAGGFRGNGFSKCIDVNECAGAVQCPKRSTCQNSEGSFVCTCSSGYSLSLTLAQCTDVDECQGTQNSCDGNATCFNLPGAYTCMCRPGFSGDGVHCVALAQTTRQSTAAPPATKIVEAGQAEKPGTFQISLFSHPAFWASIGALLLIILVLGVFLLARYWKQRKSTFFTYPDINLDLCETSMTLSRRTTMQSIRRTQSNASATTFAAHRAGSMPFTDGNGATAQPYPDERHAGDHVDKSIPEKLYQEQLAETYYDNTLPPPYGQLQQAMYKPGFEVCAATEPIVYPFGQMHQDLHTQEAAGTASADPAVIYLNNTMATHENPYSEFTVEDQAAKSKAAMLEMSDYAFMSQAQCLASRRGEAEEQRYVTKLNKQRGPAPPEQQSDGNVLATTPARAEPAAPGLVYESVDHRAIKKRTMSVRATKGSTARQLRRSHSQSTSLRHAKPPLSKVVSPQDRIVNTGGTGVTSSPYDMAAGEDTVTIPLARNAS